MRIIVWENGQLRDSSLDELKTSFSRPTWIDLTDPTVQDLQQVAEKLGISTSILIGKLRSNYPHADTTPEYTKIFAWYLNPTPSEKEFSFQRIPVIALANKTSAITISDSKTGLKERIIKESTERDYGTLSVPARIIYLTMMHLLEAYERVAEQFETMSEKFEEVIPPWPRHFYAQSFDMRKEGSSLLRVLRHFRTLAESLAKGRIQIPFTEEESMTLDMIYDRAVGAEETTETSLEIIRDLIETHLDTVSHDMNRAMRLMAAITCIVAIPSVIAALLGTNLMGEPWPWQLWQVALISILIAGLLSTFFYRKWWR